MESDPVVMEYMDDCVMYFVFVIEDKDMKQLKIECWNES